MSMERFTIDVVSHARRASATAFATEAQERLKGCREDDKYKQFCILRELAQELLAQYEAGLESLSRQWQKIAEEAMNCTLKPPIYPGP